MAQIDQLLASVTRFGAIGALLSSDEKVMLSFPGGPRYASQTTPHASLVRMVEEILPPRSLPQYFGRDGFLLRERRQPREGRRRDGPGPLEGPRRDDAQPEGG